MMLALLPIQSLKEDPEAQISKEWRRIVSFGFSIVVGGHSFVLFLFSYPCYATLRVFNQIVLQKFYIRQINFHAKN